MARGRDRRRTRLAVLAIAAGLVALAAGALLLAEAVTRDESPREASGDGPTGAGAGPAEDAPGEASAEGPSADGVTPARRCAEAPTTAPGAPAPTPGQDQQADGDGSRARPADSFSESLGVNVHLGYTDTPYRRQDLIQEKLRKLGLRYVRDGLNPGQPSSYEGWRTLASCGIKLDLIVGDPLRRWGIGPLASQLALIERERITEAVATLEGPNEYDNQGDENWPSVLRGYQRRLYDQVQSDPELSRFPVLGPTVVQHESRAILGDLSDSLDFGNMHPYPGGAEPDRDSHLKDELALAAENSGTEPVHATETGYHNAVDTAGGQRPASERASGIYVPRLYLDYFRRGIARTYAYELIDQRPDPETVDPEASFGLLREDFSEKPAFRAMSRLAGLLEDRGPRFEPDRLDYTIEGAPSELRRVLLQKRDGTFYLALWKADSVWDPDAREDLPLSTDPVRLSFAEEVEEVKVHRPSESGRALSSRSNLRSLALEASPSVTVVEIHPSGDAPPPS